MLLFELSTVLRNPTQAIERQLCAAPAASKESHLRRESALTLGISAILSPDSSLPPLTSPRRMPRQGIDAIQSIAVAGLAQIS